jgi:hypothetical protein
MNIWAFRGCDEYLGIQMEILGIPLTYMLLRSLGSPESWAFSRRSLKETVI